MEPKHPARTGRPFLATGVTFLAAGFAGQPAFAGVAPARVGLGVGFGLRHRAA